MEGTSTGWQGSSQNDNSQMTRCPWHLSVPILPLPGWALQCRLFSSYWIWCLWFIPVEFQFWQTSQHTALHIFNPLNMSPWTLALGEAQEGNPENGLGWPRALCVCFVVTGGWSAPGPFHSGPAAAGLRHFSPVSLVVPKWFAQPGREGARRTSADVLPTWGR